MGTPVNLKNIVEAALLAAGRPLSLDALQALFDEIECPTKKELQRVVAQTRAQFLRGVERVGGTGGKSGVLVTSKS